MTSSQQSLSVIAGSNFAAVDMISLRQSLSVADSKTNLLCVSRCLQQPIATADLTMLQQSLSAIAGSNFAAVVRFLCGTRGPSRTAATWMQPLRAATTSRQSVGILCSNLCQIFQILINGPTGCCSYHSSHKHTTIIRTGQTSQPLSSPLGNPHRPAWNGWVIYDNGFRCSEHMAYTTRENALDM